jgi:hypothetical protein
MSVRETTGAVNERRSNRGGADVDRERFYHGSPPIPRAPGLRISNESNMALSETSSG